MKSQKFVKFFKCDCFQPINYCTCPYKITFSDVLLENVTDVAESLVEVMKLYGIFTVRGNSVKDVIIYYFLHYEDIIHRIDCVPRKRLNKEDLMHDLNRKCSMNRIEAQMAYSIIKRAFKAFYHGTDLGGAQVIGFRNNSTHSSECLWVHAAQRTAQIYASYESIFYPFTKDLEYKIKTIYNNLYNRISERSQPYDQDDECTCRNCMLRIKRETLKIVTVTTDMHNVDNSYEQEYLKEQKELFKHRKDTQESGKGSDFVAKNHIPCSCPKLKISKNDSVYEENAKYSKNSFNQGPFECRWFLISKEDFEADEAAIKVKLPREEPCPPCLSEEECDIECECTCEDCTCKLEKECEDAEAETEHESGNEATDCYALRL